MFLLDTDILTHLHANHPKVVAKIARLDDPDLATSIITKIELLQGRFDYMLKAANGKDLLRAQQLLTRTEELLEQIPILVVDTAVSLQFDHLSKIKGLRKMGRADMLIASIALATNAVLVTRNTRHFEPVPGLLVVNWMR